MLCAPFSVSPHGARLRVPSPGVLHEFVLRAGQRSTEVVGALLEEDAARLQALEGDAIVAASAAVLPLISRV
jgi:hypothetical protein